VWITSVDASARLYAPGDHPVQRATHPSAVAEAGRHRREQELVRATQAAALAASRWVGRGEEESADQAAADAMRVLHTMASWPP
jgi:hypothetical protein